LIPSDLPRTNNRFTGSELDFSEGKTDDGNEGKSDDGTGGATDFIGCREAGDSTFSRPMQS
jgi:hypothetical protein